MEKLRIGWWVLRGSVASTLLRLSKRVAGEKPESAPAEMAGNQVNPVLQAMMKGLTQRAADAKAPKQAMFKAMLAEVVYPRMLTVEMVDGKPKVLTVDPKDWAYAVAGMLGFCVGVSVPEDKINAAIIETAKIAKDYAKQVYDVMAEAGFRSAPAPKADKKEAAASADKEGRQAMIADLKGQIEAEADPAMKAALKTMLERLQKEEGEVAA